MAEGRTVVQSVVREQIKAAEMRCGEDFLEALNELVASQVKKAIGRAKENGRQTLKPQDL